MPVSWQPPLDPTTHVVVEVAMTPWDPDSTAGSRRVGLFGGTFDPPHVGHMIVARDVAEALELDEVRFMVAARSPHKLESSTTDAETRVAMVQAAVEEEPAMQVSRLEVDRGGISWTVDTLRELVEAEPTTEWYLILGADQFMAFDRWREPGEIGQFARIVVFGRGGVTPDAPITLPDVIRLDVTRIDVSSSDIRQRIREGQSVRWLVPDGTLRIALRERLYTDAVVVESASSE